jgi:hypothetical protein
MPDTLHQWFDHLVSFLPIVPKEAWVVACVLPIALALFSSRPIIVLGSVVAVAVSFLLVMQPHLVYLISAAGAYVGGILVAIYGIHTKRAESTMRAKLTELESKIADLHSAEHKRFIADMQSVEQRRFIAEIMRRAENDPENLMTPRRPKNSPHRRMTKNAHNGLSKPVSPAAKEQEKSDPALNGELDNVHDHETQRETPRSQ